ncbi:MAG TPA: hypothetical protein VMG12_18350 [Polyangiaceae bacterium]|nr:hypothetical protein [Polyangiaceae bacterium]
MTMGPGSRRVAIGLMCLGVAFGACGSPPPAETVVVDNSINVTIYAGGRRGEAPATLDLGDPRIAIAQKKIASLLGHPLGMEFDAAVVKTFADDLQRAYVSALESTASGLADCQRSNPEAFRFGAERLRSVRIEYKPLGPGEPSDAALIESTLPIGVRTGSSRLVEGYEYCLSFERSLNEDRAQRFAQIDPAKVTPEDEAGYLEFIRLRAFRHSSEADERLDYLQRGAKLAAFRPHITQQKVRDDTDELLANFASTLHEAMASQPSDAVMVTALNEAHRAWIAWANESGTALGTSERLRLARRLLWRGDPVHAQFSAGFDPARFGMPTIERWLQDTAPTQPREGNELEACIVNPLHRGDQPPQLWFSGPCNGAVYSDLARTPEGRRRLAGLLERWHNDVLIEAAVLHTLRDQGAATTLALLDALASDREATRVALRSLAELKEWSNERRSRGDAELEAEPFIARIPSWWKSQPELRPVLLYMLVRIGEHREGSVPWSKLSQFLGRPISGSELTGFLTEDARNLWYLPALASGLGTGWPRAKAILPGIEAYFDAEANHQIRHGINQTLQRVLPVVCDLGTHQDMVDVQNALKNRAALYPSQQRELGWYVHESPDGVCRQLGHRQSRERTRETLFGD